MGSRDGVRGSGRDRTFSGLKSENVGIRKSTEHRGETDSSRFRELSRKVSDTLFLRYLVERRDGKRVFTGPEHELCGK